jgi:hypothetical protein
VQATRSAASAIAQRCAQLDLSYLATSRKPSRKPRANQECRRVSVLLQEV